ncbi:MAG: signal recognition particle receptor subunit alpha, partial [Zoogloea sp.]|nr:signal recognition particle receptor subunit alpha [Zoogloea sp.]
MFGFLKKALKPGDAPAPEPEAPEAAPATPAPPAAVAAPAATAPAPAADTPEPEKKRSWMDRLRAGLSRTREQIGGGLGGLTSLFCRRKIDEDLLEELETTLLMADCGVEATQHLLKELRLRWKRDKLETADQLQGALSEGLLNILAPLEKPLEISGHTPYIIMIAGINGSGKTTSIGKLAKHFQS